ncbi:MAG: glycosyltransferase family 9 protein [Nitrospira sp.]|nr:glycosyltransferase family 9 protein [Nitrospira sp.]
MAPFVTVIHPGALGDLLLAVPALQSLRKIYAEQRIVCIAQEAGGHFLRSCHLVDECIGIEESCVAEVFAGRTTAEARFWTLLKQSDAVIGWMKDADHSIEQGVKNLGVSRVTIRSPFDPQLTARHQSDRFLETIGEELVDSTDDVRITLPNQVKQRGQAYLNCYGIQSERPAVMLHVGSGSQAKCTTAEFLAAVMVQLDREGYECIILEGPADHKSVEAVCALVGSSVKIVKEVDLSTVAGILSQVHLYIGHDSGISHLAGLIGTPTVVLFGPTDPERWAPRGRHVRIMSGEPCHCSTWKDAQRCPDRPCLSIKLSEIRDVLVNIKENSCSSPENTSPETLSPPDPYDKVAR